MKIVKVTVENAVYDFYKKVGERAGGVPVGQVMADALFKLAGELSLNAIQKKREMEEDR